MQCQSHEYTQAFKLIMKRRLFWNASKILCTCTNINFFLKKLGSTIDTWHTKIFKLGQGQSDGYNEYVQNGNSI